MITDENNIRKYAKLMEELGLTGLEVENDDRKLRLERTEYITTPPTKSSAPEQTGKSAGATESEEYVEICSPMVGVFFCAPAENAAPFISVGDPVKKGDVVCIIESMKLMNEIVAEQDGELAEICAENGQVVDYGRPLFRLKKEQK